METFNDVPRNPVHTCVLERHTSESRCDLMLGPPLFTTFMASAFSSFSLELTFLSTRPEMLFYVFDPLFSRGPLCSMLHQHLKH